MAYLPIKYVHGVKKNGKRHYYFRRPGFKRATLPGLPGSAEFMAAYQAALDGEAAPRIEIGATRSKPGSVAAVIAAYLGSKEFNQLAIRTQYDRRLILDRFREAHGDKSFAGLSRIHIKKMLDDNAAKPHAAKGFLKALRHATKIALGIGLCETDETFGLHVAVPKTEGFRTWSEEDIAQFEAFYPIGSRERLAFGLLLYTGQRRGDVIVMGRQHVKDGVLTVRQSKTKVTVAIPLHSQLKAILAAPCGEHLTFLTTAACKPFGPTAFSNWFGAKCREAGLPLGLSAHGLRKAMCTRLAEAGCTIHQIAAISGHTSLKEIERYTKAVDQRHMARAAMEQIAIPAVNQSARSCKPRRK